MSASAEAVYEHGVLRPLGPVALSEGERVTISVLRVADTASGGAAHEILTRIATLVTPRQGDRFSGEDHDAVLYGGDNGQ